jgi:hypothetical protein
MVNTLAGCGVSHDYIALKLGIAPKTLRKHFRQELDTGAADANALVAQSLHAKAVNGNVVAAMFWLKCRAGWTDRPASEARPEARPNFIVTGEQTP